MITSLDSFVLHSEGVAHAPLEKEHLTAKQAASLILERCTGYDVDNTPLLYRGTTAVNYAVADPKSRYRRSHTGRNHYLMIMAHLLNWEGYPDRTRSAIFANNNDYASGYGTSHMLFPLGPTKVGVCQAYDIFRSFTHLKSITGHFVADFSTQMNNLKVYDTNWDRFRHDMDDLWDRMQDHFDKNPMPHGHATVAGIFMPHWLIKAHAKGDGWLSFIQDLMDPVKNKFVLADYGAAPGYMEGDKRANLAPSTSHSLATLATTGAIPHMGEQFKNEMWTDSEFLMVKTSLATTLYNEIKKLT